MTFPLELEPVLHAMRQAIAQARLGPGAYARWLGKERESLPGGTEVNPYGCADAANSLYTLGDFPSELTERAAFIQVMQEMQDPATGLFQEATHHTFHVTAHVIAALELFDARPRHPLRGLDFLSPPMAMENFLDQLAWTTDPWSAPTREPGYLPHASSRVKLMPPGNAATF
ncbi:MAG: hypothetical protein HC904_16465, partial [Blastochloris sp.]|nr:hypothetical protein [Blastochloris sp.]